MSFYVIGRSVEEIKAHHLKDLRWIFCFRGEKMVFS